MVDVLAPLALHAHVLEATVVRTYCGERERERKSWELSSVSVTSDVLSWLRRFILMQPVHNRSGKVQNYGVTYVNTALRQLLLPLQFLQRNVDTLLFGGCTHDHHQQQQQQQQQQEREQARPRHHTDGHVFL